MVTKFSLDRTRHSHTEVGRPWYDTKLGIEKAVVSLAGLNRLVRERHSAGYDRDERLNEFYILGRYHLDSCGNCSIIFKHCGGDIIPKEVVPDIPDVLTYDEFHGFMAKSGKAGSFASTPENGLPKPDLFCLYCGNGWTISNCHDSIVWRETQVIPLEEFVGRILEEVRLAFNHRSDAVYFMQSDILIRNDNNIDLSPKYPETQEEWQKGVVKNERGWLSTKDGVDDGYVVQEGDEGFFNVWYFFHKDCNRKHLDETQEAQFREIFEKAGFKDIRISRIPNEYCDCERCASWFHVNTELGTIKVGWRKRVINIDWTSIRESLQKAGEFSKMDIILLFEEEAVTKAEHYIHAWGWDKAQEYLNRIYSYLTSQ